MTAQTVIVTHKGSNNDRPFDPQVAIINGLLVGGNFCRQDFPVASLICDSSFSITACE